MSAKAKVSKAEAKEVAREELIYHLTEDLLVMLERRGLSKADLARRLNKSPSFVTQVLSGSRNMTLRTLSDICYELDIKPIIKILPDGSKLIEYEEERVWVRTEPKMLKSISTDAVPLFEREATNEYRIISKASEA